jgi:hypothetical protein
MHVDHLYAPVVVVNNPPVNHMMLQGLTTQRSDYESTHDDHLHALVVVDNTPPLDHVPLHYRTLQYRDQITRALLMTTFMPPLLR